MHRCSRGDLDLLRIRLSVEVRRMWVLRCIRIWDWDRHGRHEGVDTAILVGIAARQTSGVWRGGIRAGLELGRVQLLGRHGILIDERVGGLHGDALVLAAFTGD